MNYILLMPPVAGAFIGWITNYAAVKLLFRPHLPMTIFGRTFQGVIPKRRKDIAHSLAHAIEKELLSSDEIAAALNGIDWQSEIESMVEESLENKFGSTRLKSIPVIGVVSEGIKARVKYLITKDIATHLDRKKDGLTSKVRDNIDIREMVISKINDIDLVNFEKRLTDFLSEELSHLEWLGAIMGFVVGALISVAFHFILGG